VNIRILSCPTYFDQIIFTVEAHPESDPVAWVCIDYNARVSSCDVGLDWEAHAGAITEERSDIETQGSLRRFLGIKSGGKRYQEKDGQQHNFGKFMINRILALNHH
jgi:hypothetical protein